MKSNILHFAIVLMLTASALTASAQAQDVKSWSTAGSTGTADKNDLNKIVYSNGTVAFPEVVQGPQSSARRAAAGLQLQTVQAVIRYNVTAADGLFFDSGRLCMEVRFRDDGNRARVFLRLLKLSVSDGTSATTLLTFDSNSFSPQQDFQTNSVSTNRVPFDFAHNAYYVEATLTKQQPIATVGGGKPALAVVVLTRCNPIT